MPILWQHIVWCSKIAGIWELFSGYVNTITYVTSFDQSMTLQSNEALSISIFFFVNEYMRLQLYFMLITYNLCRLWKNEANTTADVDHCDKQKMPISLWILSKLLGSPCEAKIHTEYLSSQFRKLSCCIIVAVAIVTTRIYFIKVIIILVTTLLRVKYCFICLWKWY